MDMKIAKWYNNFQAPSVLMIDDLSDAYIDVYNETYKNDWGYLCDSDGSSFDFLQKNLLYTFPHIKITFFVPYLKHNVISENSIYDFKKYALGDRNQYTDFIKRLNEQGHEIAHHGSNHGEYTDVNKLKTVYNWTHEWALFDNVNEGINITLNGVNRFKEICDIDVVGGKYCGYVATDNSQEIIDKCNFLYWCERTNFNFENYSEDFFGHNEIISFPTTIAGNSFIRLSYMTGDKNKDRIKNIMKYFQALYDIMTYIKIRKNYKNGNILSIQEHISPSTTSGIVQSANIITDIDSLKIFFAYLRNMSIWYANCNEIATYIYCRNKSKITVNESNLIIDFENNKKLKNTVISIVNNKKFSLKNRHLLFASKEVNGLHVVNLPINHGKNKFTII